MSLGYAKNITVPLLRVIVALAGILVLIVLDAERQHQYRDALLLRAHDYIAQTTSGIDRNLFSRLGLLGDLTSYVQANPNATNEAFQGFAEEICQRAPDVLAVELARDTSISHIYPMEGNEAAMGLDLLSNPNQRDAVLASIESGVPFIAGPYELVQGGESAIARSPIYTWDSGRESSHYWGLAVILIPVESLLADTPMAETLRDYRVAIRGVDGKGLEGEIFWGEAEIFDSPRITHDLAIPGGKWVLAIEPRAGWDALAPRTWQLRIIGLTFIVLLAFFLPKALSLGLGGQSNWLAPFSYSAGFLILFTLLAAIYWHQEKQYRNQSVQDALDSLSRFVEARLESDAEILSVMARRSSTATDAPATFESLAAPYLAEHPEIVALTHLGPEFNLLGRAPASPRSPVDPGLIDPERARVGNQSRLTRLPTFTEPFLSPSGEMLFEIWRPLHVNRDFLGFYVAAISCDGLLVAVTPPGMRFQFAIELEGKNGHVVANLRDTSSSEQRVYGRGLEASLDSGFRVRVRPPIDEAQTLNLILLGSICIALSIGLALSTMRLRSKISTLIETNEALRQSMARRDAAEEALLRAQLIVSNSTDMLALLDQDTVYLAVNEAYAGAFDRTVADVIGRTPRDLFDKEFYLEVVEPIARRCLAGKEVRFREWINFVARGRRFMDVSFTPYKRENGDVVGFTVVARDCTSQKLAEDDLVEEEALTRSILAAMPDLTFRLSREGVYKSVHAPDREMLYSTPAEIVGSHISELLPPEVAKRCTQAFQEAVDSGSMSLIEYYLDPSENDRRYYEARLVPCGEEDVLALVRDITERKLADKALLKSNEMLKVIGEVQRDFSSTTTVTESLDALLEMVLSVTESEYGFIGECIQDSNGALYLKAYSITDISWNEETREFYRINAPLGLEFHNLDTLFGAVMKTGRTVISNATAEDPRSGGLPGGHPPLNAFMGLPFIENDELLGMIGIANRAGGYGEDLESFLAPLLRTCGHLISASRIELERERLRRAVEHVDESILVTNPDGIIQYVNPAFEKSTGYSRDEVLGARPSVLKSGRHAPQFYQALWDTLNKGEVWRGQFVNQRKDGGTYVVDSTVSPVLDRHGNVVNYVSVQRDITREQELEQMLLQSQKMEALGTLAGGVAHDFNNILQAILGYASMARLYASEKGSEENLSFCLQEIDQSTQRATDLVDQILTFSRKADVSRTPISLGQEIENALRFLRSSIPTTIHIDRQIDSGCPAVLANTNQIHQLLTNLCTNAMHAMENKGGTLTVALNTTTLEVDLETMSGVIPAGEYVRLDIADTGTGIAPEIAHRLLDPFFTTKGVGKGTGLGLAIVHGILSSMGAGLLVESSPGEGTRVSTLFHPDRTSPTPPGPPVELSNEQSARGHVLLVDDEPSILQFMKLLLASKGFTVEAFDSVELAEASFRSYPARFSIALLDLTMPGLTGMELANRLLAIYPSMPVLIATGNLESGLLFGEHPSNVRKIVKKPFTPHDLILTISRYVT